MARKEKTAEKTLKSLGEVEHTQAHPEREKRGFLSSSMGEDRQATSVEHEFRARRGLSSEEEEREKTQEKKSSTRRSS